jgi:hypothetical protein
VLLYGANIYAAYEIAVFRARPVGLVCGVAAVAPVIGPIVFLSLPTRVEQTEEAGTPYDTAVIQPFGAPAQPADGQTPAPADSGALRLSQTESAGPAAALPQTQVFQRGAFTFNRRFFETRFPGFFGVVRREAEKDMVLLIKSARGQHVAERITRISATDVHLHVQKGPASEEVMVPFSEIQEIQLKHKDA